MNVIKVLRIPSILLPGRTMLSSFSLPLVLRPKGWAQW